MKLLFVSSVFAMYGLVGLCAEETTVFTRARDLYLSSGYPDVQQTTIGAIWRGHCAWENEPNREYQALLYFQVIHDRFLGAHFSVQSIHKEADYSTMEPDELKKAVGNYLTESSGRSFSEADTSGDALLTTSDWSTTEQRQEEKLQKVDWYDRRTGQFLYSTYEYRKVWVPYQLRKRLEYRLHGTTVNGKYQFRLKRSYYTERGGNWNYENSDFCAFSNSPTELKRHSSDTTHVKWFERALTKFKSSWLVPKSSWPKLHESIWTRGYCTYGKTLGGWQSEGNVASSYGQNTWAALRFYEEKTEAFGSARKFMVADDANYASMTLADAAQALIVRSTRYSISDYDETYGSISFSLLNGSEEKSTLYLRASQDESGKNYFVTALKAPQKSRAATGYEYDAICFFPEILKD